MKVKIVRFSFRNYSRAEVPAILTFLRKHRLGAQEIKFWALADANWEKKMYQSEEKWIDTSDRRYYIANAELANDIVMHYCEKGSSDEDIVSSERKRIIPYLREKIKKYLSSIKPLSEVDVTAFKKRWEATYDGADFWVEPFYPEVIEVTKGKEV